MPNLFSDLPVEILAWVLASTSGLTRMAIRGGLAARNSDLRNALQLRLGFDVETEDAVVEREGDFALGLADAGEGDALAGNLGRRARRNSPSDTTSMPAPRPASRVSTAWFELAFIA